MPKQENQVIPVCDNCNHISGLSKSELKVLIWFPNLKKVGIIYVISLHICDIRTRSSVSEPAVPICMDFVLDYTIIYSIFASSTSLQLTWNNNCI